RYRVSASDPDGADRRILRGEHLRTEQRLQNCAGRRFADEGEVERVASLEVVGNAAAGNADVAGDRAQRIERADIRCTVDPTPHTPAYQNGGWTFVQAAGDFFGHAGANVGLLAPSTHRIGERERPKVFDAVAIASSRGICPPSFEEQPRR